MTARPPGEQRIARVLGAACACLLALALLPWVVDPAAWLVPDRRPERGAAPDGGPSVSPLEAPSLDRLSAMVERPVFTATRRPAPKSAQAAVASAAGAAGSASILDRYRFNGVVVSPTVRVVFVTRLGDNKPLAVAEGERLGEWVVAEVTGDAIVLRSGPREERVPLRDPPGAGGQPR
jgi:general secretion pathway protein N